MVSHKIDLEVMLIPNDSELKKSMDALVKAFQGKLGGAITSGSNSRLGKSITGEISSGEDKKKKEKEAEEKNEKKEEKDKKQNSFLSKLLGTAQLSLGVLTGIMGILSKVPSILQASLKLMSIGFLLILKPVADLLGMILMPIGIAMIKLAGFLMKYSGGAGLGGFVGMVLGGILAVIVGAAVGAPTIALGLIILFGAIAGAVLGSIIGAAAEWAWIGLIDIEKTIIDKILGFVDGWIGLPEDGFWGTVVSAIENWLNDSSDKRSFFGMLIEEFTGIDLGGMIKSALSNALLIIFPPAAAASKLMETFGNKFNPPPTANGGVVMGPQVRLVGEAGPEAIIPLDKMGGMGGVSINVNGIFEESRLRDIMRTVAEDVMNSHKQVSGSVF